MNYPRNVKGDLRRLPRALEPLTEMPNWVLWKYIFLKGKATKPPFQATCPDRNALNNDPTTWAPYQRAVEASMKGEFAEHGGIGFCLLNSGFGAFDLDHCRDPETEEIKGWALDVVKRADSYTEISPSGNGLRIIGRVDRNKEPLQRKQLVPNDPDGGLESYRNCARYITITGSQLPGSPNYISDIDDVIEAIISEIDEKSGKTNETKVSVHIPGNLPPVEIDTFDLSGLGENENVIRELIKDGTSLGFDFNGDRSRALWFVLVQLTSIDVDEKEIASIALDHRYKLSEHVYDQKSPTRYLKRQLERAKKAVAESNSATNSSKLPLIQLYKGHLSKAIDEIEHALIKSKRPVFVRGQKLVQPIFEKYKNSEGFDVSTTVLKPMQPINLAYVLTKHVSIFCRYSLKEKTLVAVDPPLDVLNGLLQRGYWHLPSCAGVLHAPTLRPDGSVLSQPGFDEVTRLWLGDDDNFSLPEIVSRPSHWQAEEALRTLMELIDEFPFVREIDRSVALSAILTAVLRGAFEMAPVIMFAAHTAGTGKSYMVNLISTIANGRQCPVITMTGNKEEDEKRLGALILAGIQMFSLDNCENDIGGALLCQVTEQPKVRIRILGASETQECEWRGVLFLTGNNVGLKGDMTRRGIKSIIDAGQEHPETRPFKKNPIMMVMEDRGKYVAAAMTIAMAYLASGEKADCEPVGSYGGWSKFCREPLIWLGLVDPWESAKEAAKEDVEKGSVARLIAAWLERASDKAFEGYKMTDERGMKIRDLISAAIDAPQGDLFEVLYERAGARGRLNEIDPRRVGEWFKRINGQVYSIDGKRYKVVMTQRDNTNGSRWSVVGVY